MTDTNDNSLIRAKVQAQKGGIDWARVDREIKQWLERENEGRFDTIGDADLEGEQLVFQLGSYDSRNRWEGKEMNVIGGSFVDQEEALGYVDSIRMEVNSIEGHATDIEGDRPLLGSGRPEQE